MIFRERPLNGAESNELLDAQQLEILEFSKKSRWPKSLHLKTLNNLIRAG